MVSPESIVSSDLALLNTSDLYEKAVEMQAMLKRHHANSSIIDILERLITLEKSVIQLARENMSMRTQMGELSTYADDADEKIETLEKILSNTINISEDMKI